MNSLNYIGLLLETDFSKQNISSSYLPEKKRRAINTVVIAWGFQRNYRKRFSLDLNLGMGYLFRKGTTTDSTGQYITKHVGQFTTSSQLNLGFWLNKRK